MAEYIDKDKVHKRLTLLEMKLIEEEGYYDRFTKGFGECMWHVANFPASDVVEVVRCGKCTDYMPKSGICWRRSFPMSPDDYCSKGTRRAE